MKLSSCSLCVTVQWNHACVVVRCLTEWCVAVILEVHLRSCFVGKDECNFRLVEFEVTAWHDSNARFQFHHVVLCSQKPFPVVWLQSWDSWPNIPLAYFSVDSFHQSRESESWMTTSQANQTESLHSLFVLHISASAMRSWLLLGVFLFQNKEETRKPRRRHPAVKARLLALHMDSHWKPFNFHWFEHLETASSSSYLPSVLPGWAFVAAF